MRIPALSEDEPIGWFEVEEDWNDVEIKLQQCRVAKVNSVSRLNWQANDLVSLTCFYPLARLMPTHDSITRF